MKDSILKDKSLDFAIRAVKLCRYLSSEKKEFVIGNQLLKSGTSIGAMIREAEHGESKSDFIDKLSIAQKECNESIYWLELLYKTDTISLDEFNSIHSDSVELMKIITSIINSTKRNLTTNENTVNN